MENTISAIFTARTPERDAEFNRRLKSHLKILGFIALGFALFGAEPAMAQQATTGLCKFAGWLKSIGAVAAIIAVFVLVINSFFSKSSVVGDIIIYVIIAAVIMVAAPELIELTGLSPGCSL